MIIKKWQYFSVIRFVLKQQTLKTRQSLYLTPDIGDLGRYEVRDTERERGGYRNLAPILSKDLVYSLLAG